MALFSNRYLIESTRLPTRLYAGTGNYFVTICTENRKHYFGEIENDKMILNFLGQQVVEQWLKTPTIRPDMNITLDEFQVMPNHFHGIIKIGWNRYNNLNLFPITTPGEAFLDAENQNKSGEEKYCIPSAKIINTNLCKNALPGAAKDYKKPNSFGPQSKNLGSVLRGFKSSVTSTARKNKIPFNWQALFHDAVIKDDVALNKIRNYIRNNPSKWGRDRFRK